MTNESVVRADKAAGKAEGGHRPRRGGRRTATHKPSRAEQIAALSHAAFSGPEVNHEMRAEAKGPPRGSSDRLIGLFQESARWRTSCQKRVPSTADADECERKDDTRARTRAHTHKRARTHMLSKRGHRVQGSRC